MAEENLFNSARSAEVKFYLCYTLATNEYWCYRHPFSSDQAVAQPDWELYLRETGNLIIQEQSPKR